MMKTKLLSRAWHVRRIQLGISYFNFEWRHCSPRIRKLSRRVSGGKPSPTIPLLLEIAWPKREIEIGGHDLWRSKGRHDWRLCLLSERSPLLRLRLKVADHFGCIAAVIGLGLIFAIAKCASLPNVANTSAPNTESGNVQQTLASAVSAQTLPPIENLSPSSTKRGQTRVALAAKEGPAGEMIYSQNCYDVLARTFSWKKLDECGGFDVEASIAVRDDEQTGFVKEAAWFEGEAVAGRYLKSAVAAGLEADAADKRLASLQTQINRRHPKKGLVLPDEAFAPGSEFEINGCR